MFDAGVSFPIRLEVRRKIYRRRRHDPLEVLRDFHLAIQPRETVCLIGPSGIGKTTILRILTGLDEDFEGSVDPAWTGLQVGMVFQEPRLLPWRNVEENIRLALPRARRSRSLDGLLADLGLTEWRRRYPGELSGGLARRAAIGRALAIEPSLLLLDEPFVSLDEQAAANLQSVVFDVVAKRGLSVLMVTHNVREALMLADRLVLLASRPATVVAEIPLDQPRSHRPPAWIEALRLDLAARYPSTISA